MSGKGGARYAGLTTRGRTGTQWSGELRLRDDVLTWPLMQRRGRRILVGSLSDPFHEKLTTETIDAMHAVMTIAQWHRFIMLTRRTARMRAYYADPQAPHRIEVEVERLATAVLPGLGPLSRGRASTVGAEQVAATRAQRNWAAGLARTARQQAESEGGAAAPAPWPLPNMSLGVAVEDQQRAGRIGDLLQTPASLRWVCFEPLLGPIQPDLVPVSDGSYVDALDGGRFDIDWRGRRLRSAEPRLRPLDWVVAGGETGAGARPTDLAWVRDLRERCAAAGVPFFFKQGDERAPAHDGSALRDKGGRERRATGRSIPVQNSLEPPVRCPSADAEVIASGGVFSRKPH
jgi:protein gp37